MGLLNSAGDVFVPHCWFCSFRTPHIRRGLLLLLLLLSFGPLPITDLVLPSSLGGDFHYTTINILLLYSLLFYSLFILIFDGFHKFSLKWHIFVLRNNLSGACGNNIFSFYIDFWWFSWMFIKMKRFCVKKIFGRLRQFIVYLFI